MDAGSTILSASRPAHGFFDVRMTTGREGTSEVLGRPLAEIVLAMMPKHHVDPTILRFS